VVRQTGDPAEQQAVREKSGNCGQETAGDESGARPAPESDGSGSADYKQNHERGRRPLAAVARIKRVLSA